MIYKKAKIKYVIHKPTQRTKEGYPILKKNYQLSNGLDIYVTIVGRNKAFDSNHLSQMCYDLWHHIHNRIGMMCDLWDLPV